MDYNSGFCFPGKKEIIKDQTIMADINIASLYKQANLFSTENHIKYK